MRTNDIKNEIDEIKKWEEKIKRKDFKYGIKSTNKVFNNMKQSSERSCGENVFKIFKHLLILVKLKYLKRKRIIMNLDQEENKVKIKKEILMKVHMKVEN